MSSYITETRRPEKELCPFHRREFKKNGKFWKCPEYLECGHSIGSRPLVGHVNSMWIRQTKKGKAWIRAYYDNMRRCTEVFES